jgi:outer membrane protein assembly factor BamB
MKRGPVNAEDGTVLWSSDSNPSFGWASPTVVGNVVYVGTYDGNLYALNANTGDKLWSYQTGGSIFRAPTVVGNVIYVGSLDHSIYALNT